MQFDTIEQGAGFYQATLVSVCGIVHVMDWWNVHHMDVYPVSHSLTTDNGQPCLSVFQGLSGHIGWVDSLHYFLFCIMNEEEMSVKYEMHLFHPL